MPYAKLQFIAYVLNTAPKSGTRGPAPPDNKQVQLTNPYYPGLLDAAQDINARIMLVARAIKTAIDDGDLGGADTLKIFMLPEFCFRGISGAYDMDSVQLAVTTLQDMVKNELYDNWVFVFGSILGYSQPPADSDDQDAEVYNFSLIQSGGVDTAGDSHVVLKELLSRVDFITLNPDLPVVSSGVTMYAPHPAQNDPVRNRVLLHMGNVHYMNAGDVGRGKESQFVSYDGNGIFNCNGIRFGMEICLDHLDNRLTHSPQIPGDTQVQVQLIPSCGAWINQAALILDDTGYAFNCDGGSWGASLVRPLAAGAPAIASQIYPVSPFDLELGDDNPDQDIPIAKLYGGGFRAQAAAGLGVRRPGEGSEAGNVVVYAPVSTPPAKTVPGKVVPLSWKTNGYEIDFGLIYDKDGKYTGVSGKISNPNVDLNDLTHMLPMTLVGSNKAGQSGKIVLTVMKGGDGYDLGIKCESTLPGFGNSGLVVEFSKTFGAKAPKKNW